MLLAWPLRQKQCNSKKNLKLPSTIMILGIRHTGTPIPLSFPERRKAQCSMFLFLFLCMNYHSVLVTSTVQRKQSTITDAAAAASKGAAVVTANCDLLELLDLLVFYFQLKSYATPLHSLCWNINK